MSTSRGQAVQRVADLALVVGFAPVWAPALGALAGWVWLRSGGPVLFRQARMGLGGRPFTILKLRTMHASGSSEVAGLFQGWTYAGDPRVTPEGRVLRRYRLDELPQLLNVLAGEMSLVGPRPEPWDVARTLCEEIPGYGERHRVRPGLTGLCQISADYYDFGTLEKSRRKLQHDLEYVRRRSLILDMHILIRSVAVVLRGQGIA